MSNKIIAVGFTVLSLGVLYTHFRAIGLTLSETPSEASGELVVEGFRMEEEDE